MRKDGLLKHVLITFLIAVAIYAAFYAGIEHRRARNGPWEVTFTNDAAGAPVVLVNQPALAITNVQFVFPDHAAPPIPPEPVRFSEPRPVPYDVPFGKVVFMDTTFLPGTLTFDLFGHEIELLPRTMIIDQEEEPWRSHAVIVLTNAAAISP